MRGDEVSDVLDGLAAKGIKSWVDGGWGVDALLERQTREHSDLDLVIDAAAVMAFKADLLVQGFQVVRDWLPAAIAFEHTDGRAIDLHPVELTLDGGGDQIQLDGVKRFHYGAPTVGRIDGRAVACCSVETQLACHLGYEPHEDDFADMRALADTFALELPRPYGPRGRNA